MFGRLPSAHICADFGNNFEGRVGVNAVNAGQVNHGHTLQRFSHADGRSVVRGILDIETLQLFQDLAVTVDNLRLVKFVEFDRLTKAEQMLRTIVAFKGTDDSGHTVLAPLIAHGGQNIRVPFAPEDGLDVTGVDQFDLNPWFSRISKTGIQ